MAAQVSFDKEEQRLQSSAVHHEAFNRQLVQVLGQRSSWSPEQTVVQAKDVLQLGE